VKKTYVVRVVLQGTVELADHGYTFGPFDDYRAAEECVIALAGRDNVRGAMIEEAE